MSNASSRPFSSTLLMPTLDEVVGMRAILPRIRRDWVDQIIVVDGGSTDGTIEFAEQNGLEVWRQQCRGMRFAYREVWPMIRGDVVITFSPDGNSVPELIPRLLDQIQAGNDLVIASRYAPGARSEDDDIVTAFGNWFFTKTVRFLYGHPYTDVMVIYRAFWKDMIAALDLDEDASYTLPERLFCTTISWEPLMSVRAAKHRLRIAEIPGDEPPRIGGVRKLQVLRWGAAYYFQFLSNWFGARRHIPRTWVPQAATSRPMPVTPPASDEPARVAPTAWRAAS
jgi:glycosyltransferase involved in cell wall biosynthesis